MCSKCLANLHFTTQMPLKTCGWEKVGKEREHEEPRRTTTRQTDANREKRLCAHLHLLTHYSAPSQWWPQAPAASRTAINPWRTPPLSMDPRKRDGFHAACLNWPCALNINTSQTLSLSLCCCLQGCWQTHGQIRPPVRVSPQPSINRHPGVCSRVFFYDGAGLECPSATQALHRHYYHFTNTHGAGIYTISNCSSNRSRQIGRHTTK